MAQNRNASRSVDEVIQENSLKLRECDDIQEGDDIVTSVIPCDLVCIYLVQRRLVLCTRTSSLHWMLHTY
jgi:hypothetical protein